MQDSVYGRSFFLDRSINRSFFDDLYFCLPEQDAKTYGIKQFTFFKATGNLSNVQTRFSTGKADFIAVNEILDETNGFFNQETNEIIIEVIFSVVSSDIKENI